MGSGAARGEGAVDRNRRDRIGIIRRSGGGAVAACAGKLERKEGVPTGKPADGCRMVGGGRGGIRPAHGLRAAGAAATAGRCGGGRSGTGAGRGRRGAVARPGRMAGGRGARGRVGIRAMGGEVVLGEAADQGAVVWATGVAGLQALSEDLGRPIGGGVKGQALSLRYDAAQLPQLFVDGLHVVPHADGTVAIGSTSEQHWTDSTATDAQLDILHAKAIAALPVLASAPVIDRWAGGRPRAKSRAPILGAWPDRPGHYVANGGFKIGFGMAPKVAETMAELILNGHDTIPDGFRL